jgi:hypothetical protein
VMRGWQHAGPPGARRHLVRGSRSGASVRPTIARHGSGRRDHCSVDRATRSIRPSRTATTPGTTWGVGHGSEHGQAARLGGPPRRPGASIRTPVTSRVTMTHRPAGSVSRNGRHYRIVVHRSTIASRA